MSSALCCGYISKFRFFAKESLNRPLPDAKIQIGNTVTKEANYIFEPNINIRRYII